MHLRRLALTDTRTFRSLDLPLAPGVYVVVGPNASGKTNLLQSIAMLATTRSAARSGTDGEQIAWDAVREDPLPAAHLTAEVETRGDRVTVEIVIAAREVQAAAPPAAPGFAPDPDADADRDGVPDRGSDPAAPDPAAPDPAVPDPAVPDPAAPDPAAAPAASRRFRVNGVARRASDLIGRLRVVLFSADDLQVIDGPPANRRRYLDITISQLSPAYVRALQRHRRVLEQRNSLLRRLAERRAHPDELAFWDRELARAAAHIIHARRDVLAALGAEATRRYAELAAPTPETGAAAGGETLTVRYRPSLDTLAPGDGEEQIEARMLAALEASRQRDIYAGRTGVGPHRDDIDLLLDGHPAGTFGSRGQQRSLALALRLAEVRLSTERTGDPPVLLLDDVLSELDADRRARVLAARYDVDQVLITTPDPERPSPAELPGATRLQLRRGALVPDAAAGAD